MVSTTKYNEDVGIVFERPKNSSAPILQTFGHLVGMDYAPIWRMSSFKSAQTPMIFLGQSPSFPGLWQGQKCLPLKPCGTIVAIMLLVTKNQRSAILARMNISDEPNCCHPCVSGVLTYLAGLTPLNGMIVDRYSTSKSSKHFGTFLCSVDLCTLRSDRDCRVIAADNTETDVSPQTISVQ